MGKGLEAGRRGERPIDVSDPTYEQFCKTERQIEVLRAVRETETYRAAAKKLGLSAGRVHRVIDGIAAYAERRNYAPAQGITRITPESMYAKGVTIGEAERDEEGRWMGTTWHKFQRDEAERMRGIEAWLTSLADSVTGIAEPVPAPEDAIDDLLNVIPIGDPHAGMYSWGEETGEDFDLSIWERDIRAALSGLIKGAPKAGTALVAPLGDTLHTDSFRNATPTHGHELDADGRYPKIFDLAGDTLVWAIRYALEHHARVIVRIVEGNHDPSVAHSLSWGIKNAFESEPRVHVAREPGKFWFHRHGKALIGLTHGHTVKPADLLQVMACDVPELWGACSYRYWYTGHIHHRNVAGESGGMQWESFNTLATNDAHHHSAGYRAARDVKCITLHKDHGEIQRHVMSLGRARAAA